MQTHQSSALVGLDVGGTKARIEVIPDLSSLTIQGDFKFMPVSEMHTLSGINMATASSEEKGEFALQLANRVKTLGLEVAKVKLVGGFAGIELPKDEVEVETVLRDAGFIEPLARNDGENWLDAQSLGDAAILALGTGSVGYVRVDGRTKSVGGHGYVISEEASGYYIGHRALNLAALEADGRPVLTGRVRPSGSMIPVVLEHFGLNNVEDFKEVIPYIYGAGNAIAATVAQLAPVILELADKYTPTVGNGFAKYIVEEAGRDAAGYIVGLAKQNNYQLPDSRIGLLGGIFKSPHLSTFMSEMRASLDMSGFSQVSLDFLDEGSEDPLRKLVRNHAVDFSSRRQ